MPLTEEKAHSVTHRNLGDLKPKHYLPFARKYRPANFSGLLGQDVLVKTLSYAIENERLTAAYLLTGIRGVGKTSSARIIAKSANCTEITAKDNIIYPCEKCSNCQAFTKGSHPDVIEMDAASRTGVDDIREIIESAEYMPLMGQKKFFIIDEVHMLSKNAFNALLKLIEEPPSHVIFIFATTEVHKIPPTIISRCQRYDLRRLALTEIYQLLATIAEQEKLLFEPEALNIIAHKSEGSARDAVSLLDQAASYACNSTQDKLISSSIIEMMLGIVNLGKILESFQKIIANDVSGALNLLHELYISSVNLEQYTQSLADLCAQLCKAKLLKNNLIALYANYQQEIDYILTDSSVSRLSILWQILSQGLLELKNSHNILVAMEMLIIKAIYSYNLPPIEELVAASHTVSAQKSITKTPKPQKPEAPAIAKHIEPENVKNIHANNEDIFSFLKYCKINQEMDLYYLMLNNLEIISFAKGEMVINGAVKPEIMMQISTLLENWSRQKWHIKIQNSAMTGPPLKEIMIRQIQSSSEYSDIKKSFSNAELLDIISGE